MNRRDYLIAYVEGTLPPQEHRHVHNKLNQSARWRAELERLQAVRYELENEMPLVGRASQQHLAMMLPAILDQTQSPTQRAEHAAQLKSFMMTSMMLILLLVATLGFTQLTASAQAAIGSLGNVPRITNTPPVQAESTLETDAALYMVRVSDEFQVDAFPAGQAQNAQLSASPVPLPQPVVITAEPSEAALARP